MLHILTSERVPLNTSLASIIDHTFLLPEATKRQIEQLCDEATTYSFATVCLNTSYVGVCTRRLIGLKVKVCTVIGFPSGATSSQAEAFETMQAIKDGAQEADVVINIGMLKSAEDSFVLSDIRSIVAVAKEHGVLTKVILETILLSDEEKTKGCLLGKEAGADFIKTSTGFANGGATVDDVRLIRNAVGPSMGVKASGGIQTHAQTRSLIQAGATRIGASMSVQIVTGQNDPIATGYS